MALTHTLYKDGVLIAADGVLSPDVALQINELLAGLPSLDRTRYLIVDLSEISEYVPDLDQAELNVRYTKSLSACTDEVVAAFIVSHSGAKAATILYLNRLEGLGSQWDVTISPTLADGKTWIESRLEATICEEI